MKKKIKAMGIGLLVGLAFANIGFCVISLLMKDVFSVNYLYEFNIMVAVMSVSGGLILKGGVSRREKWVRRLAVIAIWCIVDPLCLWLFGHFDHSCGHTNYEILFKSTAITTPIVIAVFVASYIIGDKIERKHIDKINSRLSEKSFFRTFTEEARPLSTTETYGLYSFEYESMKYTVLKVLKKASNRTVIRLEGENVLWEQSYPAGIRPSKEEWIVTKKSFAEKGTIGVILFNGTPQSITGLDENGYVSVNRKVKTDRDVYVLSGEEMKTFEP